MSINSVSKYVVDKIVDDIRQGVQIDDELAESLDVFPMSDLLRKEISKSDVSMLIKLVDGGSVSVGNLAINLLKDYVREPRVNKKLISLWKARDKNVYTRNHTVMLRLMDNVANISMHSEFFNFILANFDDFKKKVVRFPEGVTNVLAFCESRLNDKKFQSSKKWVYLCGALASDDKKGARALLKKYASGDKFHGMVAKKMLEMV